jgi:hypothetical protein
MSSSERTRRLAGLEAATVFCLILFYIWWLRFRAPYSWIGILAGVVASHVLRRESPVRLGFRPSDPMRNFFRYSLALLLVTAVLLASGILFHTIRTVSWQSALSSLGLYCAWGFFQQYLLNGYFVNRLAPVLRPPVLPVFAATLFCLVHLPNWLLMIVTLAGGYLCAKLFIEDRNLYFLGIAHGVVGFLIYLVVPDAVSHHLYVGPKWFAL